MSVIWGIKYAAFASSSLLRPLVGGGGGLVGDSVGKAVPLSDHFYITTESVDLCRSCTCVA